MRHVAEAVDAKVVLLFPGAERRMTSLTSEVDEFDPGPHDLAVAHWVFDHGETAGHGTATLPGSAGLYIPCQGFARCRGRAGRAAERGLGIHRSGATAPAGDLRRPDRPGRRARSIWRPKPPGSACKWKPNSFAVRC